MSSHMPGSRSHANGSRRACLSNEARHALETERIIVDQLVVVVAKNVRVGIGRFEDGQGGANAISVAL